MRKAWISNQQCGHFINVLSWMKGLCIWKAYERGWLSHKWQHEVPDLLGCLNRLYWSHSTVRSLTILAFLLHHLHHVSGFVLNLFTLALWTWAWVRSQSTSLMSICLSGCAGKEFIRQECLYYKSFSSMHSHFIKKCEVLMKVLFQSS